MMQRLEKILPLLFLTGLVLWGGYVVFTYIGADAHLPLLTEGSVWRTLMQETASPFLRGLDAFLPMLEYVSSQFAPLVAYVMISLLAYSAFVTVQVLRTGKLYLELRFSPLHFLLLFLGSVWLLTTTLFYADIPGMQQRVLIDPTEKVYAGAGAEGLAALRENYQNLLRAECLHEVQSGGNDAHVYSYSGWCMQKAFVKYILSQAVMLLFLALDMLVLGSMLLHFRPLRLNIQSPLIRLVIHSGVGAAVLIVLLWFLALVHALITPVVWGLLIGILIVGYRFSWDWTERLWKERWVSRQTVFSGSVLLAWLLVSYLAFNFLTVIRPFPIGWDDLGRYINNPRQMASFGHLIPGMSSFQWEYLTALGFVLFGYFSTFGSTFAMEINWFAGLLAILAILACTRLILGPRTGRIAALVYYTLPMVGHFSFADMKTENAIFAFGALGLLAAVIALTGEQGTNGLLPREERIRWLFLSGLLFAAAFGTKPTIILLVLLAGVILTAIHLGAAASIGAAFLSFLVLLQVGGLSLSGIAERMIGIPVPWLQNAAKIMALFVGMLLLFWPVLRTRSPAIFRERFTPFFLSVLALIGGFLAGTAPWMMRNFSMNENHGVSSLFNAPNTITPWIQYSTKDITSDAPEGSRGLPEELALDSNHEQCIGTARQEELERYWGFGTGPMHFLGLPWRVVMNQDSQGYYLMTSPLLLLVPLVLLLPAFYRMRMLRLLFLGTMLYLLFWIFLASGIPWYGIGMFLELAIVVEALYQFAPSKAGRIVAGTLLTVSFLTSLSFRMWQFDMQKNLYEYPWGKASADVLMEMTVPDYDDISEHVMRLNRERPNHPYLYRMGTFISYFVPQNLKVIALNDNQLSFFNCLNQEGNHVLTLKRLQALGFHSIIFDTNTATIERDSDGTLHQKVRRFLEFANDESLGITSVVNNPDGGVAYMILPEKAPEEDHKEQAPEASEKQG